MRSTKTIVIGTVEAILVLVGLLLLVLFAIITTAKVVFNNTVSVLNNMETERMEKKIEIEISESQNFNNRQKIGFNNTEIKII